MLWMLTAKLHISYLDRTPILSSPCLILQVQMIQIELVNQMYIFIFPSLINSDCHFILMLRKSHVETDSYYDPEAMEL